jgi:hypothetical protein
MLPFENAIIAAKLWGMILELCGLSIVILGLLKLREHFAKPKLRTLMCDWLSGWRDVLGGPPAVQGIVASTIASTSSFGRAQMRLSATSDDPVELQLDTLRRNVDALFHEFQRVWKHHDDLSAQLSKGLKEERGQREAAIAQLSSHHEEASVGDFGMELTGVFLVLIGGVLSGAPDWVVCILQAYGRAIVGAFAATA